MLDKKLLLPLTKLNRVGPNIATHLSKLVGGNKIFDLLLHKPTRLENIAISPRLFEVINDDLIIIKLKVKSHIKPNTSKQPFKVLCYHPTGHVTLVFFKIFPSQLAKMPLDKEIAVMGRLQRSNNENKIVHPSHIIPADQIETLPKINVIYPLSYAITKNFLTQKIKEVLGKLDKNDEWIEEKLLEQKNWPSFNEAVKKLHFPTHNNDFLPQNSHRKRLAYDELLAWQLAVLLAKDFSIKNKKFTQPKTNLIDKFIKNLPFQATNSQIKAINEIKSEICSNKKMLRLLQGDVGSGKTIVAIASALQTISQAKQACIIAPTTVLAKQHFNYFSEMLKSFDIKIALLTSATTKKQKEILVKKLQNQEINILISTHAALEEDVKFKNLGLAIIDEQHRFGVMQRLKLVEKGSDVDVLLMSATPIPRSLMMALYGNMDISILSEKPKNRQNIQTLVMSEKKQEEIYDAIKRAIVKKEKIYWVCPAIEENEEAELISIKEKFSKLAKVFGENKIAMLHGKMKDKEKEEILNKFSDINSGVDLIVSTTVIEVGIDVKDATVMVIENSENFGLSQLHQLRGRVGRSDKQSYCILLYGKKFGVKQRQRLNIMRDSNDGFYIAEEDLKLRGSGELIGTKQSGFPEFKIADLSFDNDLLKIAHKQVQIILENDRNLKKDENEKYRFLLQLFGYDECFKMITSG